MATPTRRRKKKTANMLLILILVLTLILAAAVILLIHLSQNENTPDPTTPPTQAPTAAPTDVPTDPPTEAPTDPPTEAPTDPPYTGWQEVDGVTYYLIDDVPCTGVQQLEGTLYCFGADGALQRNTWLDVDGKRYYATETGQAHTGWLELDGQLYYLQNNGIMTTGQLEIDGKTWFFTSQGRQIYLVNPWNYLPDDYTVSVKDIPSKYADSKQISRDVYDDLMRMITDCEKAMEEIYGAGVHVPFIRSAFRSMADQRYLFDNKVAKVKAKHPEYTQEEAEREAATSVAIPGTSEHQLGIAVDIVDSAMRDLNTSQEKTPVQKWLMEHSWEYGFILRYPNGTTDITGIIYEPWHYRYVGAELAAELHNLDITLEEYLADLTA